MSNGATAVFEKVFQTRGAFFGRAHFKSVYRASDTEHLLSTIHKMGSRSNVYDEIANNPTHLLSSRSGNGASEDFVSKDLLTSYLSFGLSQYQRFNKFKGSSQIAHDPDYALFSDIVIPGVNLSPIPASKNNNELSPIISGRTTSSSFPEGGHVATMDGAVEWRPCEYLGDLKDFEN